LPLASGGSANDNQRFANGGQTPSSARTVIAIPAEVVALKLTADR
jgi:hypothetical protein